MQGLKKYTQLLTQLEGQEQAVTPEALFQLNRSLEIELLLVQRQIDNWAKQIVFIQSQIHEAKEEEEESSSWLASEMDGDCEQKVEETSSQHDCSYPNCNQSYSKQSALRCHCWLAHQQQLTWQSSINLELDNDPLLP